MFKIPAFERKVVAGKSALDVGWQRIIPCWCCCLAAGAIGKADKGIAVLKTDSTNEGRVGAPDNTDARTEAADASSLETSA